MEIDENGVVNPLRPPRAVAAAGARIAGLPPLAIGFLVVAVIDLIVGIARLRAPSLALAGEVLVILLPVAVLTRRRDAAVATPGVLWGTMLVALAAPVGERPGLGVGGAHRCEPECCDSG